MCRKSLDLGGETDSKPAGFFRVDEREGRWWFITPAGDTFYAVGTDHASYLGHPCEKLGYAPYHRKNEEKYGDESVWAEQTASRLLEWGFNTLGWGHSPSLRYRGLAHTQHMDMGVEFAKVSDISPQTTWTGFPNVFDPRFVDHCDRIARESCEPCIDDPWLLGYFTDNELEWFGRSGRMSGLFEETMVKEPGHSAKGALVHILRGRYGDIRSLNESWGTEFRNFDDLHDADAPPDPSPATEEDARIYLMEAAKRYFSATTGAIRKQDSNHLILGCRFGSNAPPVVWEEAGRQCDVVSVNCYRRLDLERGVIVDGFEDDLKLWYGLAGSPLMLTEWSFPALDAGLPCTRGAGQRVQTQGDRARAFLIFQRLLFSTPFVVGSDYFMWVDEPALGISRTFPEDCNYGLVNEDDQPYAELTRAAADLNPRACRIHAGLEG